jgi:hypothetical protein
MLVWQDTIRKEQKLMEKTRSHGHTAAFHINPKTRECGARARAGERTMTPRFTPTSFIFFLPRCNRYSFTL